MTPIGHLSVSYITGKSFNRSCLAAVVIGGILPDIDFVFILFDWFNQVHRVITHNIYFIVLACLIPVVFFPKDKRIVIALSLLSGGLLHLFIDSCMDNNPSNGVGIALFWPFSREFYSPFNVLRFSADSQGWNDPVKMLMTLIPNMLFEVPFYIISAFLLFRKRTSSVSV